MVEATDGIFAELHLKYQQYADGWKIATAVVDGHTAAVERANKVEASVESTAATTRKRRTSSEAQEAREQVAIQKQAAREIADEQKAQAKAAAEAVKAAVREKVEAEKSAVREIAKAQRDEVRETAAQQRRYYAAGPRIFEAKAREFAALDRANSAREPSTHPINISEPAGTRLTQAEYEASEARRAAAIAAIGPSKSLGTVRRDPFGDDTKAQVSAEREINAAIADRATLQAGLIASTRAETVEIRDQLAQFRLIDQYKRAGLSETEAAIRAEEVLAGIEGRRAARAAELAAAQTARTEKQLAASTGKTAGAITAFAPVLVGGITVHEISALNDAYITLGNTLRIAGVGAGEFDQVQAHLLATANRSGTEINALADVYRGAALASHDLGASQADLLRITDAAANALRISGRSTEDARGALLQLSHAFESGRVTAREFNGLALNLYPILQAVARGSDQYGGSVAKLRQALLEGDLTSKVFFQDLLKGADDLEKRAATATLTTAQGFNALKNSLIVYFGEADKSQGVSAALGFALQKLADNLDVLIPAIAAVGTALTVGYITKLGAAAIATENLGGAILAAFGGPVGLAITAVTLALGSFAVESNNAAAGALAAHDRLLDLQGQMQLVATNAAPASSGVRGIGTDALGAIPSVRAFAGEVGNLAQQLYNQARAARAARVEGLQQQLAAGQKKELEIGALTPTGRADAAEQARKGDFLQYVSGFGQYLSGAVPSLLSGGRTDRERQAQYRDQVAGNRLLQQQIRDARTAPITPADIPGGAPGGVGTDPKAVKALASLNAKLSGLETLAGSATGTRLDRIKGQIEKTKQKISDIEAGASLSAANAAEGGGTGRGRRGPSADTLAKREEAARLRAVHDDEGYTSALKQAHDQELQASIDLSNDTAKRADLERQRVRDAAEEMAKNIRAKGPKDAKLNDGVAGTGERTTAETNTLLGINANIANIRGAVIDQTERRRNEADIRSLDNAELEARRDALQLREGEVKTLAERRRLAKDILDLDYQLKEKELRAVVSDTTKSDAERVIAGDKLRALPGQKVIDEKVLDRQNEGPLAQFRRSYDDPATQVQQAVADKLKSVDDAITDAAAKTLGVKDPFLRSLLQIFLEQNVLKPLYDSLENAQGGGSAGGIFGSILKTVGSVFGHRATGGPVVPGASYLVGERGPEVVRFGGAGNVYPNGVLPNVRGGGNSPIIIAPQHYDLTGVVMTESLVQGLREDNRRYADAVGKAAVRTAVGAGPGNMQSLQTLGNPRSL